MMVDLEEKAERDARHEELSDFRAKNQMFAPISFNRFVCPSFVTPGGVCWLLRESPNKKIC
jgi:hypothetical protein